MIGLHEIVEETETGAYAVELASALKVTGIEVYVYADKILENQHSMKANERNIKMTDNFHEGVGKLKGEFLCYVALDEWAADNVPMNIDPNKLVRVGMDVDAMSTAVRIIKTLKDERNQSPEGTSENRKPKGKRKS